MKSRRVPLIWALLAAFLALAVVLVAFLLASSQYRVRELDIHGNLESDLRRAADILADGFESARNDALAEAAQRLHSIESAGNRLAVIRTLSLNHSVIRQPFLIRSGGSRVFLFPLSNKGILRPLTPPDRSRGDARIGGMVREGYRLEEARMYIAAIRAFQRALGNNQNPAIEPYILASVARNYRKLGLNLQADMFLNRALRVFSAEGSGNPDFYFTLLRRRAFMCRQNGNPGKAAALYADLFEKSLAGEPVRGGGRYAMLRNEAADYLGRYRREQTSAPRPETRPEYIDMSLQWRYHDPADWEAREQGQVVKAEALRRIHTLNTFDGGKARYYNSIKNAGFWDKISGDVGDRFFKRVEVDKRQIRIALICVAEGIYFGFSSHGYICGRETLADAGRNLFRKHRLRLKYVAAVGDDQLPIRKNMEVVSMIEARLPGSPRLVLESSSPGYMARRVRGEMLWGYGLIGLLLLVMSGSGLLLASYLRRERQLVQARHDFLNLAAHTLRTPVTRLALLTESLRSGWTRNEGQRRDFLDSIDREAVLMKDMVNHLLDFARMEEGVRRYEKQSADLAAIVDAVVSRFFPRLMKSGFDFETEVEKDLPVMWLDPRAIEMVVSVLLHNAVKYADKEKWIRVRVFHQEDEVVIQVADHGRGIPERDLPKVFEKFYRSTESGAAATEGTGLGLYMAQHAVRAHGGTIKLDSRVGNGTTATVNLPVIGRGDEMGSGHERT